MAASPNTKHAIAKKLVENLQSDLHLLSTEAKRKYPQVKEASEAGLLKIRTLTSRHPDDIISGFVPASTELVHPFVLGCETKNPRLVQICLVSVQRLISHEAISMNAANSIISLLWQLMEAGLEELKLLQTAILLITTNSVVQHEPLSRALVLCFRLHFTKDSTTINTAAATIKHLVSVVFERVVSEDKLSTTEPLGQMSIEKLKAGSRVSPDSLRPCAGDAYLLFQDLCQLVNADQPFWLMGMTEMTRTFGLELLESVLTSYSETFLQHPEFSFLLKERVCPLVIKLFSPSLKYRQGLPAPPSPTPVEKPFFPIVVRLLRIVSILIRNYYSLLTTECEIFLSLLVKFLDPEKPLWQRCLTLEVIHRLCIQPSLLRCFCESYDMKPHSTKIFRDIVNALGAFIQSQFMNSFGTQNIPASKLPDTQGSPPALVSGFPMGGGVTPQPAFMYRGVWIPVTIVIPQGQTKPVFLEMLDKIDPPPIADGYGLSLAFYCLLDVVKSVEYLVQGIVKEAQKHVPVQQAKEEQRTVAGSFNEELINSSWCGVLAALSLLLDASTDETATESILKALQSFVNLCGRASLYTPRDAFITALCKASLPPHYALTVLNTQGGIASLQKGHSRTTSQELQALATESMERSHVVAVGTPLPTSSMSVTAQSGPVMLTAKNIQCMRALLSVAHCHGSILGTSWHLLLTTLQHLVWILGLKPSAGGSLKAGQQINDATNAVITTAVMADLPILSAMLSRLFESSQYLDDVALHHLIDALCKLSTESMEMAYSNRVKIRLFLKIYHWNDWLGDRASHYSDGTPQSNTGQKHQLDGFKLFTKPTQHGLVIYVRESYMTTTDILRMQVSRIEMMALCVISFQKPLIIIVVYPPEFPEDQFSEELECHLERIPNNVYDIVIAGDFNNPENNMLRDRGFSQHITGPTHQLGATLDLIFTSHALSETSFKSAGTIPLPYTDHNLTWISLLNSEPSLFAVAKLLETGLVNLARVEVLWKPVTNHLLEVCQHPQQSMRAWGGEAITSLITAAVAYKYDPPLHEDLKLQSMLLLPLQQLSGITQIHIRQKQLECVLQILHQNADSLLHGWPVVLNVVGAITNEHGESLIRLAFQSLQLVVQDYLPIIPCNYVQDCVEVAAKFGLQTQDLNISLTSVGLLWNISDYFYQNQQKLQKEMDILTEQPNTSQPPPSPTMSSMTLRPIPTFDTLWMCLFSKLGDLCVDGRPAVRKSAGQTLFSTISAHGGLLYEDTWKKVLWQVLFPLLERVYHCSSVASTQKDAAMPSNILIHHTRDTAEKQWAETRVLTLAGVARTFNSKKHILQTIGDFPRAWSLLLEHIENSALCPNSEVSLAAIKSFQEILSVHNDKDKDKLDETKSSSSSFSKPTSAMAPIEEVISRMGDNVTSKHTLNSENRTAVICTSGVDTNVEDSSFSMDLTLWTNAWKVFLNIGVNSTKPPSKSASGDEKVYVPSQAFLTALMQSFPALFEHICVRFVSSDLHKLAEVIKCTLSVPVHGPSSPFIIPTFPEITLTPLQESVLIAIDTVVKAVQSGPESMHSMYPELFDQLLAFVEYAVRPPRYGNIEAKAMGTVKGPQVDWVMMNFVPFAEKAVERVVTLYKLTAKHPSVTMAPVLHNIIKTFHYPLALKYGCPSPTMWILVISSLLSVLNTGLTVVKNHASSFQTMWKELALTLEEFLFSKHPSPSTLSVEDFQRDEAIDCQVIELIRDDILPHAVTMPHEFTIRIMAILNRGSIHSAAAVDSFIDTDSSCKLREEFAKSCFEILLQFSFVSKSTDNDMEGSVTKMAVLSLLQRCQDVVRKYVDDEKLSGKCPLPRPRLAEMVSVLKAVTTLLATLKKAPPNNVESSVWTQVIALYPALVDCTTSQSPYVCKALKEALHQYKDLLSPLHNLTNGIS